MFLAFSAQHTPLQAANLEAQWTQSLQKTWTFTHPDNFFWSSYTGSFHYASYSAHYKRLCSSIHQIWMPYLKTRYVIPQTMHTVRKKDNAQEGIKVGHIMWWWKMGVVQTAACQRARSSSEVNQACCSIAITAYLKRHQPVIPLFKIL